MLFINPKQLILPQQERNKALEQEIIALKLKDAENSSNQSMLSKMMEDSKRKIEEYQVEIEILKNIQVASPRQTLRKVLF